MTIIVDHDAGEIRGVGLVPSKPSASGGGPKELRSDPSSIESA